jgi:hypothetical protein
MSSKFSACSANVHRNLKFPLVLVTIVKLEYRFVGLQVQLIWKIGTYRNEPLPVSGKNLPPTRVRSAKCRTRSRSTLRPPVLIPIPRHFLPKFLSLCALNAATFYKVQALLGTPANWKTL